MAGRHHIPPKNAIKASSIADSRILRGSAAIPASSSSTSLEDRVAIQHHEIQTLLVDNQRFAATHVALKQELAAAQLELRSLASAAADAKAHCDARVRDIYERSLKAEAEASLAESAPSELDRVRGDVRKLAASRDELAKEVKEAEGDLSGAREGLKQVKDVKTEIDSVRREIQRGRAAIEREKKTWEHNLEFLKAMEEKMVSMATEIEKCHAEIGNVNRGANLGIGTNASFNSDMGYGGQPFPKSYNIHRVRSGDESNPQYGSGPMSHGSW